MLDLFSSHATSLTMRSEDVRSDYLDLSACTSIRTLYLQIGLGEPVSWHDIWYWNAVAHILSTTSTSLQNIIFGIYIHHRAYNLKSFKSVDWMRVDDGLSRLRGLRSFTILSEEDDRSSQDVKEYMLQDDLKEAFRARFPSVPPEIIHWSQEELDEGVLLPQF